MHALLDVLLLDNYVDEILSLVELSSLVAYIAQKTFFFLQKKKI